MFAVVGQALFAFLVSQASSTSLESKIYDPYEILGIKKVCARVAEARRADGLPTFLFTRASQRRRSSQTLPEIVRSLYAQ